MADDNKKATDLIPKEWLYNPVVYSQISGDFSLMQQRVLVGILERLQERIKRGISYQKQLRIWPSLFDDDELNDNIVLEIDPRSLGVIPANYEYLQDALKALMKIQIGFPKKGKTKTRYVVAPLFARAEMPYYKDRKSGKIRIVMLKENVQDFFNLSMGYTIHLAKVAQLCQKKRTPRIYIFLSHCKDQGQKDVDYDEFCKFLGIDEDTAKLDMITRLDEQVKKGEITKKERTERIEKWENPYRKFSKVKSLILEPSRKELDEFVRLGEIDFTFTYEPIYDQGRMRGNPSKILFAIVKGDLAIDFDKEKKRRESNRYFVEKMAAWCPDMKADDIRLMLEEIPVGDQDDFKTFCYGELRNKVEYKQPDDVASYSMALMEDWINNRRIANGRKSASLFAEQELEESRQRWEKCREDMLAKASNEEDRRIFARLSFESFDIDTKKLILVTTMGDYTRLDEDEVVNNILRPNITKHFGKGTKLNYRVFRKSPNVQGGE